MNITPQRLAASVQHGFRKMKHLRSSRMAFLRQYVTRFYSPQVGQDASSGDDRRAAPLNLLFNGVTTMVPNLVYGDPRCKVRTRIIQQRQYANVLELATNHLSREVGLRTTLRKVVTDALFMAGWIKVGLGATPQAVDIGGELADPGQVYADRVDNDDMVIDPTARSVYPPDYLYIGSRFRVPLEWALESGMYPNTAALRKAASRYDSTGGGEEASSISEAGGSRASANELAQYVDLVELYLPGDQRVVTLPWTEDGAAAEYVSEIDYMGPEGGPYHMLGFAYVPDNLMPVPPVAAWYDTHILANRMARKIARQADRSKRIIAFEPTAAEEAGDVMAAEDGDAVRVANIDAIKEIGLGGTAEENYQYVEWARRYFGEMAMNIDLTSGVSTGEPTLGQAEMLQANVTVRLADMQQIVYHYTAAVMKHIAFFLHTDPLIELPLVQRMQNQDVQVTYTPEMREGDFLDYSFDVQPYSMARQDPNLKARRVMEFAGNVIPALAQATQILGPGFNLQAALQLLGREMGIEELDELINLPALEQHMAMQALQKQAMEQSGPAGGGSRPQQPNPRASIRQGMGPKMESNQMNQEASGELQSVYSMASRLA